MPSPGDLLNLGMELLSPAVPALSGGFFTTEPLGGQVGGESFWMSFNGLDSPAQWRMFCPECQYYLPQRNSIHSRMGLILHLFYSLIKTFLSSFMSGLGLESVDLVLKTQPPINFKGPQWVFHSFSPTLFFCWFFIFSLGDMVTSQEAAWRQCTLVTVTDEEAYQRDVDYVSSMHICTYGPAHSKYHNP